LYYYYYYYYLFTAIGFAPGGSGPYTTQLQQKTYNINNKKHTWRTFERVAFLLRIKDLEASRLGCRGSPQSPTQETARILPLTQMFPIHHSHITLQLYAT
jgi:hypothetical protein